MLRSILIRSWYDHPTNTELNGISPEYHILYAKEEYHILITTI